MIQNEPTRWEDSVHKYRDNSDKEAVDSLLGRRSSPPTDSTIHQQPPDDRQTDIFVESSEQIERRIREARTVLEPERHKLPSKSLIALLNNANASELSGELEQFFGKEDSLAPSKGVFSGKISARDRDGSEGLYSLLERPIVNLKWRSDGR